MHTDTNTWKLKSKCNDYGTLKCAVSKEIIDKLRWFFACWNGFRKAKNHFGNFWLGVVKNGHGNEKSKNIKNMMYLSCAAMWPT